MKYKNNTDKVMFFNIGGKWINIQPGATIELIGRAMDNKREGLVLVNKNTLTKEDIADGIEYILDESKLKSMTKDELNDYAASVDIDVKGTWLKSRIIKKIIKETDKVLKETKNPEVL